MDVSLRLAGALAALLALSSAGLSAAELPAKSCERLEVLAVVARHYARAAAGLELVPDTAAATRTEGSHTICVVTARVPRLDPVLDRIVGSTLLEPRYYEIQELDGGLRIDFAAN